MKTIRIISGIALIIMLVFLSMYFGGRFSTLSSEDAHVQKVIEIKASETWKGSKSDGFTYTIPACANVRNAALSMNVISENTKGYTCRNANAYAYFNGNEISVNCAGTKEKRTDQYNLVILSNEIITSSYSFNGKIAVDVGGQTSNLYDHGESRVSLTLDYITDYECDGTTDDIDECIYEFGDKENSGCPVVAEQTATQDVTSDVQDSTMDQASDEVEVVAEVQQSSDLNMNQISANVDITKVSIGDAISGIPISVKVTIENLGDASDEVTLKTKCNGFEANIDDVTTVINPVEKKIVNQNLLLDEGSYVCQTILEQSDQDDFVVKYSLIVSEETSDVTGKCSYIPDLDEDNCEWSGYPDCVWECKEVETIKKDIDYTIPIIIGTIVLSILIFIGLRKK